MLSTNFWDSPRNWQKDCKTEEYETLTVVMIWNTFNVKGYRREKFSFDYLIYSNLHQQCLHCANIMDLRSSPG